MSLYIGTFVGTKSKGIYLAKMDPQTGALSAPQLAARANSPSFLAFHPKNKFLYAAERIHDASGREVDGVAAYSIDPSTFMLSRLNEQPSGGTGACFVAVDHSGTNVLVANYNSGSVAVLPIDVSGLLRPVCAFVQHHGHGPDPQRQTGPHAHCFNVSSDDRFALACDLGLDQVLIYRFQPSTGTLTPSDPPFATVAPGSGARHLAFHPNGKFVYVINEMGASLSVFAWDARRGSLSPLQTLSTVPDDFKGQKWAAEVQVHPSGRFLYASNRTADSIAIFGVDQTTGQLTPRGCTPTQGQTPRNFTIDPTGQFLVVANQDSDSIVVFRIDPQTGALTPAGSRISVPSPTCVRFAE